MVDRAWLIERDEGERRAVGVGVGVDIAAVVDKTERRSVMTVKMAEER